MGNIRRIFARKECSGHRWRSYFGVLSLAVRWLRSFGARIIARCATARARSTAPSSDLSLRKNLTWSLVLAAGKARVKTVKLAIEASSRTNRLPTTTFQFALSSSDTSAIYRYAHHQVAQE